MNRESKKEGEGCDEREMRKGEDEIIDNGTVNGI